MEIRRAITVLAILLAAWPRFARGQAALRSPRLELAPATATSGKQSAARLLAHATDSHPRATWIGATAGAVVGGLGSAGFILNALAPNCVTAASLGPTVSSSHCGHRSGVVMAETATIVVGTGIGAFGGVWIARRIAAWHDRQHHDPPP